MGMMGVMGLMGARGEYNRILTKCQHGWQSENYTNNIQTATATTKYPKVAMCAMWVHKKWAKNETSQREHIKTPPTKKSTKKANRLIKLFAGIKMTK